MKFLLTKKGLVLSLIASSTVLLTSLFYHEVQAACVPGINCPAPDLFAISIQPTQTIFDSNLLAEDKFTKFRVGIGSTFTNDITVPVKLEELITIKGQTVVRSADTRDVLVHPGLENQIIFPPDPLRAGFYDNDQGQVCFRMIIDPQNSIARADDNGNNQVSTCPQIKDTMQLRLFYMPIDVGSLTNAPACSSVQTVASRSSAFVLGAFPIADEGERQLLTFVSCIPVGPFRDHTNARLAMNDATWLSSGQHIPTTDVPHHDIFIGVYTRQSFGGILGEGSSGSLQSRIFQHSVIVNEGDLAGFYTAQEIAHNFGLVPPSDPLWDGTGHLKMTSAPGYWVNKQCQMGSFAWSTLSCNQTGVGIDFMYYESDFTDTVSRWISKDTWENLMNGLSAVDS